MKRDAEFVSYQHEDVTIDFQIKTSKQTMCLKTANVQQTMRNPKCEHKKIDFLITWMSIEGSNF